MGQGAGPADLQEAVERSYRAQWGGRRYCFIASIVLFVLAVLSAIVLTTSQRWLGLSGGVLKVAEITTLTTSFVCLIAGVMFALESMMRSQRERGELPDRTIHAALTLSLITVVGLLFLLFMRFALPWETSGIGTSLAGIIQFILFLFCGLTWLGSVGMNSAGITMLVTRRSPLLEVNNTSEGTTLLFKRGYSGEIVKLSIASFIPLIIFVIALLMAGAYML